MKKKKRHDPYQNREATRYKEPIVSREYIIQYLEEAGKPLNFAKLAKAFAMKSEEQRIALERRLTAMVRDGQLLFNRRSAYGLTEKMQLLKGHVTLSRDGSGFFRPENSKDKFYMAARQVVGLMNGDKLLARVSERYGKMEAILVEVLERSRNTLVGRLFQEDQIYYVDADDRDVPHDIIISEHDLNGAKPGSYVELSVTPPVRRHMHWQGKIIAILGDQLTPGVEVELATRKYGLPVEFPDEVLNDIADLPNHVTEQDMAGREDLRHLDFVTIDGEDAKDFDDAVYCEPQASGWRVWVAIADVSHYVKPGMALDDEAETRATSIYFPSKVIPMLPEKLSNHLCSLVPAQDRLAMVCEMVVDADGLLKNYQFYPGVIHSKARLTYTLVNSMLQGDAYEPAHVLPAIHNLYQLYLKLRLQRELRGAVEFDSAETQILFDDNSKIADIVPRFRNEAHRLIEELMLLANQASAYYALKHDLAVLYRNHDVPEEDRLMGLRDFLKPFSLRLSGSTKPKPLDFCKLLHRVSKRKDAKLIETVILRTMSQAVYERSNIGHFGLALDAYTHFTSPIRRYPDLLLHRAIKQKLRSKKQFYTEEELDDMGTHCSDCERRADRATREAMDWLKCDYMKDRVGEVHQGKIVDVVNFGVFVELVDVYVQGLLHVTELPSDYYIFDNTHHRMVGEKGGRVFRLGDEVTVMVGQVDLDKRRIDFSWVEQDDWKTV